LWRYAIYLTKPALFDPFGKALAAVCSRAAAAVRGETTLAPDLAELQDCGVLAVVFRHVSTGCNSLVGVRRIGRVNLSVGRKIEEHADARRLVAL